MMWSKRACLLFMLCSLAAVLRVSPSSATGGEGGDGGVKVLSRKRRYLTFPEGSSLQVVFDQTIPIVGTPLVFTIGVTVALAYELPSEPWYHYIKDIRKNWKSSTYLLGKKDQNVSQLIYTDQGKIPDTRLPGSYPIGGGGGGGLPAKANLLDAIPTYNYNPVDYNKHTYYYKDSSVNSLNGDKPWDRIQTANPISYYANPVVGGAAPVAAAPPALTKLQPVSNKLGYYFGKSPNQLASVGNQLSQWMKYLPMKLNPKQPILWSDVVKGISKIATANRKADVGPLNQTPVATQGAYADWKKTHRKHPIPVFGKRSVDEHLIGSPEADEESIDEQVEKLIRKEEEKHFLRHHRKTRHDLYSKIEVFLNSKGLNGRECVLRTLCETGHKHQAHHLPNTFAAELIKTIFKLPKLNEEAELTNDLHITYDLAHHSSPDDCADLYSGCEADLWTHPFLY